MIRKNLNVLLMSLSLLCGSGLVQNAAAQSCQSLSDAYAIVAGKGFGFAPANVRAYWKLQNCTTSPSAAPVPVLCQELSDRFNISSPTTGTDTEAKGAYAAMGCNTKPTCQGLSDKYAIVANKGFGLAPPDVQNTWKQLNCNVSPAAARNATLCQELSDHFGLVSGQSASADTEAKGAYTALGCKTKPTCQGLSNNFAVVANKGFGLAPADVQTFWKATSCATNPAATRYALLCPQLSTQFGISPTAAGTNTEAKGAYTAMACKTQP